MKFTIFVYLDKHHYLKYNFLIDYIVYESGGKMKDKENIKSKRFFANFCAWTAVPVVKRIKEKGEASDKKHIFVPCLVTAVLFVCLVLLFAAIWIRRSFGKVSIASILFTLQFAQDGFTTGDIIDGVINCLVLPVILTFVISRLVFLSFNRKSTFYTLRKSDITVELKPAKRIMLPIAAAVCIVCILLTLVILPVIQYVKSLGVETKIYDEHYVFPTSDVVSFPEGKRNLVYIYLESMENTYADKQSGGAFDDNYIPNLTALATNGENISFSNTDKLGGASVFSDGMSYTMGAFVSSTTGVPVNSPSNLNKKNYKYDSFMPGIRSLEDILHDEGYNQMLIQGSTGYFAGMNLFYGRHDNTTFFPYEKFVGDKLVPEGYDVFWGVEDIKVYDYAKLQLSELSKKDEPFALTLFTIDTHRPEGYICEKCKDEYPEQYANVISCADKQIAEFLDWLSQQEYYENTTVIVVGDHPSMNEVFFSDIGDYRRTTYNCFINSAVKADSASGRIFSTADMLPTTLAAMGAQIKGDRLGLGTDLFSGAPTLAEQLGCEALVSELNVKSEFYNKNFWLYE